MIKLLVQILTIAGSGLTGMYFVSTIAMENVVLKFENKQKVSHKMYNDSLENARQLFVKEMASRYEPNFTLNEQAEVTERIVNDGIKSLKRFVKNEDKKQEEMFKVVYFLDEKDSTFKLLTYKGSDGKTIIVRQIPISTNEFNEINN